MFFLIIKLGEREEKYKIVLSVFVFVWLKKNEEDEVRNGSSSFVRLF